mmetsp:Transcript_3059/g.10174  ORF Transcript_3059/g.10174 Transcript_3059/m.10174 type:complete len:445 (+) Transcript_3059:137-1471(+)
MPHDLVGVHTVLAGLLFRARPTAAVAAATSCPDGHYRTGAIVWDCSGTSGNVFFPMKPNSISKAMDIPSGVEDFSVNTTCDVDAAMQLVESASENEFLDYDSSRINNMELLHIPGAASVALDLNLQNFAGEKDTAIMSYRYRAIRDCAGSKLGCSPYDGAQADAEVRGWSCWAQTGYGSGEDTWAALGAPEALDFTGAIPWHHFGAVWAGWPGRADNNSWQYAFHKLDVNHDQQVTQEEFLAAYRLCLPTSSTAASGWTHGGAEVGYQGTASTPLASHAWTTTAAPVARIPGAAANASYGADLSALGLIGGWRPSLSPLTVGLYGGALALLSTLLVCAACSCSTRSKPVYRSLPSFEDEVEGGAPEPEGPEPPEEVRRAPTAGEAAWHLRPIPRVRTVMATVPKVVMRPLPGVALPVTGLMQPLGGMSLSHPPPHVQLNPAMLR